MNVFRRTLTPSPLSIPRAFSTSAPRPLARMQIIGRLADVPEITPTSTGKEITRFAVGVSSGPRDEQGNRATSWYRVASFSEGPQRELLLNMEKGQQIYVDADAKMDTYETEDPNDRNRRITKTSLNLLMRTFEALQRPQKMGANPEHGGDEAHGAVASA